MKRPVITVRQGPLWLDAQEPLSEWYSSGLGQSIAQRLEIELASRLGDVFGYQGLQIGNLVPGMHLLAGAGLQRRLILNAPSGPGDIHADILSLPVASGTMKAVAFFHTLDFCSNPHLAMREASRVLTDDGQLIVVGFNPYSAFGLRHALTAWRRREPWSGRFYARRRVSDWLSLLDYRVLDSSAMYMLPPINSQALLRRMARLESLQRYIGGIGGIYVMRARKQTIPMTLVRQWGRSRSRLASGSFARTGEQTGRRPRATVARIDSRSR
ncbi:MAG: class I SAM-dependent methyltransferase [Granulosicoccus sp.]|nr:class I SAM-dependent methyltransferase [Granulosicoccus sp.]